MDDIEFIKEIETEFDVSSIKVNNIQLWPFLRIHYAFGYLNKYLLNVPEQEHISLSNKKNRVKNIFYGFKNLFRRYDYLIFSDTMELRLIEDKYFNKLAQSIISYLGDNKTLLIENPVSGFHFKHSKRLNKNIISLDLFRFLGYFYPFKKRLLILNENILKQINSQYALDIDYNSISNKFFVYTNIFKFYLKIYKPKLIFISSYYDTIYQSLIHASRTCGIKVIELQHGSIDSKHPAYNLFVDLDKSFFPEYLFVLGGNMNKIFNQNNYFIDKKNVFPTGNMYIDFINNEYELPSEIDSNFLQYRGIYNKIIAVSSQYTVEAELIEFLKESALLIPEVLFIFIPRDITKDYSNYYFPKNIIILKDLDVYQTTKYSDFHSTVYSTCAIEAPALGVPNILINIKNESKKYYSEILNNPEVTRFVDTPEEFVKLIQTWAPKSKEEIKQLHEGFYAKNHKESLKKALDKIMNDTKL